MQAVERVNLFPCWSRDREKKKDSSHSLTTGKKTQLTQTVTQLPGRTGAKDLQSAILAQAVSLSRRRMDPTKIPATLRREIYVTIITSTHENNDG